MASKTAGKILKRSKTNRMVLGVCAGLGDYLGVDPTAIRLITVLVAVFTGIFPVVLLYIIAAILMPE